MIKNYDFIVDSHCHLDLIQEKGLNIANVIKDANNNNIKILHTISTKVTEFNKIKYFTNNYSNVFCSIGNHPNEVDKEPGVTAKELVNICNENNKIISIGETGLDYYYQYSKKENQIQSFLNHIEASRITNFPIVIHSRDADKDMINILDKEIKKSPFKILLHCFSSTEELAFKALDLGGYISIAGIVTFKSATNLQNIVKKIPLDRILVETDSPYLAPVPYRGKINQPVYVKNIVDFIADIKNIDKNLAISQTTNNFFKLFNTNNIISQII